MKIYDYDPHSVKPPYPKGQYVISLHRPVNWYQRRAVAKGKTFDGTNIDDVIRQIVDLVFNQPVDEEALYTSLNLDCIIAGEASKVIDELIYLVQAEIMAFFPAIGAELPEGAFWVGDKMELIINVPATFEEQRGYFF